MPKGIKGFQKGHRHGSKTKGKKRPDLVGNKYALGNKLSNDTKARMSLAKSKEKHPNWSGGVSFQEYSLNWGETLRRSIRERDRYVCQICSKQQGDIAHDVHHIDYNKQNCAPTNLITLCHSCHTKTSARKNREFYIDYFGFKTSY